MTTSSRRTNIKSDQSGIRSDQSGPERSEGERSDVARSEGRLSGTAPMASSWAPKPLRLRARDRDDLVVLSAQLQDAIVPVMDMGFLKDDGLFAMVVNRFRWDAGLLEDETLLGSDEQDEEGSQGYYLRTHCAIRFAGVKAVASKNLDTRDRAGFLNLLAITADVDQRTAEVNLLLAFSGGAWTQLTATDLDVTLEDLGEPWPTSRLPVHDDDEADAREAGPASV